MKLKERCVTLILLVAMLSLVGCLKTTNSNVCAEITHYSVEENQLLDKEEKGFMTNKYLKDYHNLRNQLRVCE